MYLGIGELSRVVLTYMFGTRVLCGGSIESLSSPPWEKRMQFASQERGSSGLLELGSSTVIQEKISP